MTVLIGIKNEHMVFIMGDCRRSKTDVYGNFLSIESDDIRKVHIINNSTIIALGGIAAIVDSTIQKVKEKSEENMTIEKIVDVCKISFEESRKVFFPNLFGFCARFSKNKMKKTKRIYASFMVAGINEQNRTFLISFNSNDFLPSESTSFVDGNGNMEVINYINNKNSQPDPITCVALAIRNTSKIEKLISPNSYGIAISKKGTQEYTF